MSTFFLQHKELFEFDKFVGGGAITASTPSFLEQYRECERQQVADVAHSAALAPMLRLDATVVPSSTFMIPTNSSLRTYDRLPNPNRVEAPAFPMSSSTAQIASAPRHQHAPVEAFHPRSPDRRAADSLSGGFIADHFHLHSRSAEVLLGSPKRTNHATEVTRHVIPRLNELLIDASTRAGLVAPPKRLDDAKKVELLIGSKCVGRISAAASSSLPPAIRHRLEASGVVHQRRERLYALLRDEYMRLTS